MSRIIERAEQVDDTILRAFFAYWRRVCGDRPMPRRGDIDPIDMPHTVLPHLILLDVQHDPLDFRYRLAGTLVVERSGFEFKGRLTTELPISRPMALHAEFAKVAGDGRPRHSGFSYRSLRDEYKNVERVVAPLSEDGVRVTQLIGAAVFRTFTGSDGLDI